MSTHLCDEQMQRLLGGSLPDDELREADAHLWRCPDCRDALQRRTEPISDLPPLGAPRSEDAAPPCAMPEVPGYEILGELGRGGMALVYQARQLQPDRIVALKMIRAVEHAGPMERLRFQIETEAVARLQHTHIVQLYEAGEVQGRPFFSLEYCDGGTLAQQWRQQRPTPREAAGLIEALARAMHYAHLRGVVHRDLKPSNVLLAGPEQVAKITDFGLAKRIDAEARDVSQSGAIMGTASYMAPEQAAGKVHDTGPATDVYGLGALLYECLTAQPPFQAETALETLQQVLEREPLWPSRRGVRVPRDLETICLKCLNKVPARRYASAEDLANDLRRFQAGEPIRARAVGTAERTWKWARRRPAVASLLAVLAITVASSLIGFLTLWRHSEAERSRAEHALVRALESDKAASGAVRDLVGLLASTTKSPQRRAYERLVESSRLLRELTAKLRQVRGVAASDLIEICGLERDLAKDFWRRGKYPESRTLFMDAMGLLGGRISGAEDPDLVLAYARSLVDLGVAAHNEQRYDETLDWHRRAELALVNLAREPRNLRVILSIDDTRTRIADLHGLLGQEESRRGLLESHIRMLERLSERPEAEPAIGLMIALARVGAAPDQNAIAKIRAAMERFPADRRLPEPLSDRMAVWITRDLQAYPPEPMSTGKPPRRLDPEVHARSVLLTLDSRCEALGVSSDLLPAAALQLAEMAFGRATEQRKAGRLDDARWTAASLLTFGKLLARRNPDEAAFHVVLCEAFNQEAKNAWRVDDYATVESATRNELVAALTAIRLDPRNVMARIKVAGLQDKMDGLISQRPPPH